MLQIIVLTVFWAIHPKLSHFGTPGRFFGESSCHQAFGVFLLSHFGTIEALPPLFSRIQDLAQFGQQLAEIIGFLDEPLDPVV